MGATVKAPEASDHDCPEWMRINRMNTIQYKASNSYECYLRNRNILAQSKLGISAKDIAKEYGLTCAAVRAIILSEAKHDKR